MSLLRFSTNLNDTGVWTPEGDSTFVTTPFDDGLTGWRGSASGSARLEDQAGSGIFSSGTSTVTVGCWVKLLGAVAAQTGILSNEDFNVSTQGGIRFGTHFDDRISLGMTRNGNQVTTTTSVGGFLNTTDFKFVVGTANGDDVRLFVDGVRLTGGQLALDSQILNGGFTSGGFNGNPLTMLVGCTSTTVERFLNAEIHRPFWRDDTLSDAQVLALYNNELITRDGLRLNNSELLLTVFS